MRINHQDSSEEGTQDDSSTDNDSMRAIPLSNLELGEAKNNLIARNTATKASKRNKQRETQAQLENEETIKSKYLESDPRKFFNEPLQGPDDTFIPPREMMEAITRIAQSNVPVPQKPRFHFSTSPMDLETNAKLLHDSGFDIEKCLEQEAGSTMSFGSEFRPLDQLRQVLGKHDNFGFMEEVVRKGMSYHFKEAISENDREEERDAMLERGNHKSASENLQKAQELLQKDVRHGFSIPFPAHLVPRIKHGLVQPIGMVTQGTVNERGERTTKHRLTQDLSFCVKHDNGSINSRIDIEQYPEMVYGWCLLRTIHYIHALRWSFPSHPILMAKYDYSDAYRRMAHSAQALAMTICVVLEIAYMALRLTFGGSANPPGWCAFSEMVTDLSNEIIMDKSWDPTYLHSPAQPSLPSPILFQQEGKLTQVQQAAVLVPISTTSRTDVFIDDLINTMLDTEENRKRVPHAVPLAIHVTSRPHAGEKEPIPRRPLLSPEKIAAEGTHTEKLTVLGWLVDTRNMKISLTDDKYASWKLQLYNTLLARSITFSELETLIGRLNHAATVLPLARHFLNRIRRRIIVRKPPKQSIRLSENELQDLHLWKDFLKSAHQGILLDKVIIRQPSFVSWADACPYGMGGYLITGKAWRLRWPKSSPLFGKAELNNFFEFLAQAINILLICDQEHSQCHCILALGDNTSALGWIFRSPRIPESSRTYNLVQQVSRKIARSLLRSPHVLATQHLAGEENIVSDLLSFASMREKFHPLAYDDPDNETLTQRFHQHLSSQIPATFQICPLPDVIFSWVTQMLQAAELCLIQDKKKRTRTMTDAGGDGLASATKLVSTLTPSSLQYPQRSKNLSAELSSTATAHITSMPRVDLQASVAHQWSQTLCEMPQAVWLRRSGNVWGQAPSTSRTARTSCHLFADS